MSEKGFIGGLIGGAISGGLVGMMKLKKVSISSNKQIIQSQSISQSTNLLNANYKFAIILFHGDGDNSVTLTVTVGSNSYSLTGDEQAIELVANDNVSISADGSGNTPTIEILSLTW